MRSVEIQLNHKFQFNFTRKELLFYSISIFISLSHSLLFTLTQAQAKLDQKPTIQPTPSDNVVVFPLLILSLLRVVDSAAPLLCVDEEAQPSSRPLQREFYCL